MTVSGGKGAQVDLHYAEALYLPAAPGQPRSKGNRNEVDGKRFLGPFDTYLADGGAHRLYRPRFWRTWRYVKLDVATAERAADHRRPARRIHLVPVRAEGGIPGG